MVEACRRFIGPARLWMNLSAAILALTATAAAQQGNAPPVEAVWTKTKVLHCDIEHALTCRKQTCVAGPKAPAFRIDLAKRTICALAERGCTNEQRIGQIGFDPNNTWMAVHALGFALVFSVEAAGSMNGADLVRGRVVVFHGTCRPG